MHEIQPLISVIIPIYNVEPYLKRAVDSVLSQTYTHLEVILVDDGSPDGCGVICDEYKEKDKRVVVIHKQNGGLSDARNAGLEKANGEYIAFLDSDDFIAPFFISTLYYELIRTESDVAFSMYQVVEGENSAHFVEPPKDLEWENKNCFIYNRKELLTYMYDANHPDATYFIVSWNKLYKAELWEGIRFPKGKIHEDEATTYKIFHKCKKGVYIKNDMHGYFSAPSSITRDRFNRKRLQWMEALTDRIQFFEEQTIEPDLAFYAIRARADGAIRYYYPLKKEVKDSTSEQESLKEYVRQALRAEKRFKNLGFLTKWGYSIFLISPSLYKLLRKL